MDEQEQLTSGLTFPEGPEKVAKTSFKPLEEVGVNTSNHIIQPSTKHVAARPHAGLHRAL